MLPAVASLLAGAMALDHVRSDDIVHPLRHGPIFGIDWNRKSLGLHELRFWFILRGRRVQLHFVHFRLVRKWRGFRAMHGVCSWAIRGHGGRDGVEQLLRMRHGPLLIKRCTQLHELRTGHVRCNDRHCELHQLPSGNVFGCNRRLVVTGLPLVRGWALFHCSGGHGRNRLHWLRFLTPLGDSRCRGVVDVCGLCCRAVLGSAGSPGRQCLFGLRCWDIRSVYGNIHVHVLWRRVLSRDDELNCVPALLSGALIGLVRHEFRDGLHVLRRGPVLFWGRRKLHRL